MGTEGFFVPHLKVVMNPSNDIKTNCENVIRFPLPGSALNDIISNRVKHA